MKKKLRLLDKAARKLIGDSSMPFDRLPFFLGEPVEIDEVFAEPAKSA